MHTAESRSKRHVGRKGRKTTAGSKKWTTRSLSSNIGDILLCMSSSFCWQVHPHKLWILPSKLILYIKTGFVSLPTLYSSSPTSHFQHSLNIHWHNSCRACAHCFLACERAHSSLQLYLQRMPSRWQLTAHSFKAVPSSWPALELSAMAQSLWGRGGEEETAWLPPLHLQFQNAHWFGTEGTHGSASSYFNNESHKHLYQKIKSNYLFLYILYVSFSENKKYKP